MKKALLLCLMIGRSISGISSAQTNGRGDYGSTPMQILDKVVNNANDQYNIQDTPLEAVNEGGGQFNAEYKIANTLDSIRYNIAKYIQWVVFIGMALAVIGIIITGLLMVTKAVSDSEIAEIKNRVKSIVIGVLILGGFVAIIRLVVSLITSVVGQPGGSTGF